jgi:hypothetical protein
MKLKYLSSTNRKVLIPIKTMSELSGILSRPTIYKLLRTRPDLVQKIQHVQHVVSKELDLIFTEYKVGVYKHRSKNLTIKQK